MLFKRFIFGLFKLLLASSATLSALDLPQHVVDEHGSISINIPEKPLTDESLQVTTSNGKTYVDWTRDNRTDAFASLQKTAALWKQKGTAEQYLVYGKQAADKPFNWEIVPYHKTRSWFGRIWQQLVVLWRITFGGKTLSEERLEAERVAFKNFSPPLQKTAEKIGNIAEKKDAFCDPKVINKQRVLEGKSVNVLYNYAPIGFGGERLHFLITPKEHRTKFTDLTQQEYLEATELAQKLMRHFKQTRKAEDIYLFHKTGIDAGQTVPHWHMHLIVTANKTQGFFGKLTVLKNMLFGSSPMKDAPLKKKVNTLSQELNPT